MSETANTDAPIVDNKIPALPMWVWGAAAFVAAYTIIQLKTVIVYYI